MTLKMNGQTVREIKNEALAAVEAAKRTLREKDEIKLPAIKEFSAAKIKALREREKMSMALFAEALGVSRDTVAAWEYGNNKPRKAIQLLLSIVDVQGFERISLSLNPK